MSDTEGLNPLRRLQLVELDLMRRFAAVCKEHGLRYYLLGGTLLGAVRHKGFIPWDDDVDICMPRPDYERLLKLAIDDGCLFARSDESEEVKLVCIGNEPSYRQGMAKITSSRMRIVNRSANQERVEDAWIDLIPLDGFPSGAIAGRIHKARLMFWKIMDATAEFDYVVDIKRDRGAFGTVALKALRLFCRIVRPYGSDYHAVLMKMDQALKRYPYEQGGLVINLYAAQGFKEIFPEAAFEKGAPCEFEGSEFLAPVDVQTVLTIIYGDDYMIPPPKADRNWHNSEVLDA